MFGNNDHEKDHRLNGVNCSVTTCTHHATDNSCHAANIKVGTEYACDKSETFCTTYQHKPGL